MTPSMMACPPTRASTCWEGTRRPPARQWAMSPTRRSGAWQDGSVPPRVDPLDMVRTLCLDLPDVNERPSHGAPTFFIRDKTTFVMFHDDHHGDGRLALWCAAPPGVQEELVETEPDRFFRPPYVGHRGWVGV